MTPEERKKVLADLRKRLANMPPHARMGYLKAWKKTDEHYRKKKQETDNAQAHSHTDHAAPAGES